MRGPGVSAPGSVCDEPIVLTDILPTVLEAVGLEREAGVAPDGASLLPLLRGGELEQPLHELIVHHSSRGRFAVRAGRWKLIFDAGSGGWSHPQHAAALEQGLPALQLYDLDADPSESTNLVGQHPEVVADLSARFRALVDEHGAEGEWWRELPWQAR